MKRQVKFFALAAAAVMALSACTADKLEAYAGQPDTNPESPSNAISFGTYMGKTGTTRAGVAGTITTASLKTGDHATSGFGVMAYKMTANWADNQTTTAPNFMYNTQVTWNTAGYWTYSPVKYWPNGIDLANAANSPSNTAYSDNTEKLNFFAYAPWVDAAKYTGTEETITLPTGSGSHKAYWATGNSLSTITNGIAAFTYNGLQAAPEVMYYMPTATAEDAVDLLWGLRGSKQYIETDNTNNPDPALTSLGSSYNVNLTKQVVPETVDFLFKHALSKFGGNTKSTTSTTGAQQCGLKVVVDIDGNGNGGVGVDNQSNYFGSDFDHTKTLVTIKKVKIQDGASVAGSGGVAGDTKSNLKNSGWFNLATGAWNDIGIIKKVSSNFETSTEGATYNVLAETDGAYKLDPQIAEPSSAITGILSGASWTGDGTSGRPNGVTTTAKNVYSNDTDVPALFLIPAGNEKQTLYVTVDYLVRTADTHLVAGYSEVEQTITNKVELTGLDVNKYYTLVMHLGLTSVKFSAVVADWSSKEDATYDESGTGSGTADAEEVVWLPSNVVSVSTSHSPSLGTSSNVNLAANTTSYTLNIKGLVAGQKIQAAANGNITEVKIGSNNITSEYTIDGADIVAGVTTITLTVTANDKVKAAKNLLTITQKDGSNVLTTTSVNLVQSAFDIVLTETTAGTVVTVKDGDGTAVDVTNAKYTVTAVDSEGVTTTAFTTAAAGTITMTTPGTYTVKVQYNDGTNPAISRSISIKQTAP